MEAWIARAARLHGDRVALIAAGGDRVSYATLFDRAARVAGALRESGVEAGDRVALALPGEELVVAVHGCTLFGAVAVPIDLRLRGAERSQRTAGAVRVLDGCRAPIRSAKSAIARRIRSRR